MPLNRSVGQGAAQGRAQRSRAARPQLMRAMNEQLLLEQVRQDGPSSRAELARVSGLSKPTVALALASLEHDGLVRVAGQRTGVRGPAALLYEIRPEAAYVLGLDVGHEFIRGAIADLSGTVRAKASQRTRAATTRSRLAELAALADALTASAGLTRVKVAQTVIGSPGVYDPKKGALTMASNLPGWGQPIVLTELRRLFGRATVVENDVNLAALAERDKGHGQGVESFAFVSVGTGTGMGLIIDYKLHRGAHGAAGEISYLPLSEGGLDTESRRRGAFEVAASASAVVRAARKAGARGKVSARRIFEQAAGGDPRASSIVREEAALIARALAAVIAVVDPPLIVLGGGIGRAPGFATEVASALEGLAPVVPEIRVSALGDDAVVDGCLAAGIERAWHHVLERG